MNAGLARGTHHWNWETFREGMEYTVGGIAWARFGAGIGYSPYKLKASTLEDFSDDVTLEHGGSAKVFRERFEGKTDMGTLKGRQTSPWQEHFNLGQYHERVIAITQDGKVYFSEFYEGIETGTETLQNYLEEAAERRSEFAFVGVKRDFSITAFRNANPRNLPLNFEYGTGKFRANRSWYNKFSNNCQYHAAGVHAELFP
jgi:hypothetical protein